METWRAELYHHGILGMHWFERNGPPYPLDRPDAQGHSGSEIRAGYKKSIDGTAENAITKYGGLKVKSKDNLTPEEKEAQERRRKTIRNAVIITAAAVGVGAAVYYLHKKNTANIAADMIKKTGKNISKMDPDEIKDIVAKAHNMSKEDIGVAYRAGEEFHRMHGFKDFDLSKSGDFTFLARDKVDVEVYKALLADTNATKERYDVTLNAVKDIIAPSRDKTTKIIEEMIAKDPSFKKDIIDDLVKMEVSRNTNKMMDEKMIRFSIEAAMERNEGNAEYLMTQAVAAFGTSGETSKKLKKEMMEQGFNAIQDFHDLDVGLSKSALIVLDQNNALVKTGEKAVSELDRKNALDKVLKTVKNNEEYFALQEYLKRTGILR